jgi:glycosyltransferase involved in cell wall biosynthesis/Tfp pilus assembly protein PilF
MIVRDEEEMLPQCLAAVAPAVDEIVIVDTGSTDSTIEIARSFGARVIEREWTGSFSDARNASFDAATGDWIVYLDADEVLVDGDAEALRQLTGRTWREAFFLMETNFTGDIEEGTAVTHNAMRVFRNRPEYRFEGRLHEQIAQNLPGYLPERLESTTVRVSHYGYLGAVRDAREKSRRNIELLRRQQEEGPPTPFLHYNLGSEYAAAGDAQGALSEFERAWELVIADSGRYEFTPSLISRLVKALRACGRLQDAIARADDGLQRFPGFTDLVLEQAIATNLLGRREESIALFEQCIEMGDAPSVYTATVGCGTYLPRISLAEIRLAQGDIRTARELLAQCMVAYPGYIGSILPYATALLLDDMPAQEVVAEVLSHLGAEPSSTARFMLGTALAERGAPEAAEEQFRAILESHPRVTRARVALGEVLLAQSRYVDAAQESGQVMLDDPLAPIAARTELFGRLAAGQLPEAERALARATEAQLDPHEVAVFSGWLALAAGKEPIAQLPAQSAAMLATVLEALLRVQDFETFAVVQALTWRLELPKREQRELLAGVYMRRGFLASAAEQWMAVCETDPDVRALVGLAHVAGARGMPEEAASFAREALLREPANPVALSIAEAVASMRG